MKIALLGARSSGKTVYWSALYHEFHDAVAIPPLLPSVERRYRERGIDCQVGFRIHLEEGPLLDELRFNSSGLDQEPITDEDWPEATKVLDTASCQVTFDFAPIERNAGAGRPRTYEREINLYDPPGGAFDGEAENAGQIIESLRTCDAAIVFLPMDALLRATSGDGLNDKDFKRFNRDSALRPIEVLLSKMREEQTRGDVFPICFVVSKADKCFEDDYDRIEDFLYNESYGIIHRLSVLNADFMICVCPISVLDPEQQVFRAMNLEWPFLFAAAATIFRNHSDLMGLAEEEQEAARARERAAMSYEADARRRERDADELAGRGWWHRMKRRFLDGETVSDYREQARAHYRRASGETEVARSYRNSAGRKINLAKDDKQLAFDTWASLSAEGDERRIRIYIDGMRINDIAARMS